MGAWGVKLYQDDVTCDTREDYLNRLRVGMSNLEATKDLISYYQDYMEDEDDGPLFWFALADTQWKYGKLLSFVKEEAIKHIKSGTNLKRWQEDNPKQYLKRKKVLEELKEKLNSPQPPEKKVSKISFSRPIWDVGDILLYQIKSEEVEKSKWFHQYVLFRVDGILRTNAGTLPQDEYYNESNIVTMYNWVGDSKPNLENINHLDLLKFMIRFGYKDVNFATMIFPFRKKELKQLNFEVIQKDPNYKNPEEALTNDCVGMYWLHSNNLDPHIVQLLEMAEELKLLIDDTSTKN